MDERKLCYLYFKIPLLIHIVFIVDNCIQDVSHNWICFYKHGFQLSAVKPKPNPYQLDYPANFKPQ